MTYKGCWQVLPNMLAVQSVQKVRVALASLSRGLVVLVVVSVLLVSLGHYLTLVT